MDDTITDLPAGFKGIEKATKYIDFDQESDSLLGSLLSTLAASRPHGNLLELGTGSGLSASWILHGMDSKSKLRTIDTDGDLVAIAKKYLAADSRVEFNIGQGEELILSIEPESIDFIFADAWPGKYTHIEETLLLLRHGGIYLVDDMLPRDSWPEGHSDKANKLVQYLENRKDIILTKLCWSTGIIICTKQISVNGEI